MLCFIITPQQIINFSVPVPSISFINNGLLLGFNLDQHFTWGDHIDKVVRKCNGLIGALVKGARYLDRYLLRLAYVALIRSHLDYCSTVLMSASATQLGKLDVIQRKAARVIMNVPRDAHSAPLLEELSLESLSARRFKHSLSIILNILCGNCQPALSEFFVLLPDGSMAIPGKSKLRLGGKRFRMQGVDVYNEFLSLN